MRDFLDDLRFASVWTFGMLIIGIALTLGLEMACP